MARCLIKRTGTPFPQYLYDAKTASKFCDKSEFLILEQRLRILWFKLLIKLVMGSIIITRTVNGAMFLR
jgi:hypothetical protein